MEKLKRYLKRIKIVFGMFIALLLPAPVIPRFLRNFFNTNDLIDQYESYLAREAEAEIVRLINLRERYEQYKVYKSYGMTPPGEGTIHVQWNPDTNQAEIVKVEGVKPAPEFTAKEMDDIKKMEAAQQQQTMSWGEE